MPKALIADLGGAERAFSAALALLFRRERTGEAGYVQVALADAAKAFTGPLRHGFTQPGGGLGGGFPGYANYAVRDGYIALGALEPHFMQRVEQALALPNATHEQLAEAFAERSQAEWERWAEEHDIPLAPVRDGGE